MSLANRLSSPRLSSPLLSSHRSSPLTYTHTRTHTQANIQSLNQLILIEATKDTVVYPYESEQFGGYKWGTKDTLFTIKEGEIYTDDLIGLKELDAQGKLGFNSYPGQHVQFSQTFWDNEVLPFFNN